MSDSAELRGDKAAWMCPKCFRTLFERPVNGTELCPECEKAFRSQGPTRQRRQFFDLPHSVRSRLMLIGYWLEYRGILMTLAGGLLVAALGWVTAGGTGVVYGLLLGAFLTYKYLGELGWEEGRTQMLRLLDYVPVLASAASADGPATDRSRTCVLRCMRQRFSQYGFVESFVIPFSNQALNTPRAPKDIGETIAAKRNEFTESALGGHLQHDICAVLFASGDLTPGKIAWIQAFDASARLSEWQILAYYTRPDVPATERRRQCLAELGLSEHAGRNEIRDAYKALARQYHPDVQGDLPVHLKELVHRKMVALNEAYAYLKGETSHGKLFFRDGRGSAIQPDESREFVCTCWMCQTKLRIPPEAVPSSARCSECHALLGLQFNPTDAAARE